MTVHGTTSSSNSLSSTVSSSIDVLGLRTFIVDDVNDVVIGYEGSYADIIRSSVSYTTPLNVHQLALHGATGFENLTATGSVQDNVLYGNLGHNVFKGMGGNDLIFADNDWYQYDMYGNPGNWTREGGYKVVSGGNDTLDGGEGADTMMGGNGDDVYYIDNVGDLVVEGGPQSNDGGNDTVYISILDYDLTLLKNVENIYVTGIKDDTYNAVLPSSRKASGTSDADAFFFKSPKAGALKINGFDTKEDTLLLSKSAFKHKAGGLASGEFKFGSKASNTKQHFGYDEKTDKIWYDVDGSGSKAAITLGYSDHVIKASDFFFI